MSEKQKELIYSLTKKDFRVDTFKGSGPGGQKRNKTASGVRITHLESGAVGQATESRSQYINKRTAFWRMFDSKEFQMWHMKQLGLSALREDEIRRDIKTHVDEWMKEEFLRIEYL